MSNRAIKMEYALVPGNRESIDMLSDQHMIEYRNIIGFRSIYLYDCHYLQQENFK